MTESEMNAMVYFSANDVRFERIPVPEINDFEVLIKVKYCGLCQSDVKKIVSNARKPPRVFGHEFSGVIEKVGKSVSGWKKGDKVIAYHHIPCFKCYYCLDERYSQCETYRKVGTTAGFEADGGGFAEFVKLEKHVVENGLFKIPENVDFKLATMVEPVNCCLAGIIKLDLKFGDKVAILGQGQIGLILGKLASASGAEVTGFDLISERLLKSKEFGVEHTLNAGDKELKEKVNALTNGIGFDKV
ncbi:MAG: alcohol dehydrogenase catalytic domain-containing protein, partial [archaeon]